MYICTHVLLTWEIWNRWYETTLIINQWEQATGTLSLRVDYQPPGQRPRFARCLQEGDMSKIKHMFSYSTSTVWQILPGIIAGYRQILPVQALECTYLLGLQAGMETAIYIVSPNHLKEITQ